MSYFGIHDIKRDRKPYQTNTFWLRPNWAPEIYNTPWNNLKKIAPISCAASVFVESIRHIRVNFNLLHKVYEYPKNSLQWSIYMREIFKTPNFWSEYRKRMVWGCFQHTLDSGFKIAIFHWLYGGTWGPYHYADFNLFKNMIMGFGAAALTGWTNYPLTVARKAYYADKTWPVELQKGYRSPLHAFFKILVTDGPSYLFRGGMLHYIANTIGYGWVLFFYTYMKDKFSFTYRYNDSNYSFFKFMMLGLSFFLASIGFQPFFAIKETIDTSPRERGGRKTFGTTWQAFKYLKYKWEYNFTNLLSGYSKWLRQYGFVYFITIWYADNLGMMDNYRMDNNRLETTFAQFITD